MLIKKSIAINLLGGAWNAVLLVATTPWFVSRLGIEGYGFIGFWMVVFYISLIFDFGLGSALARELARCTGRKAADHEYRGLMSLFERPVLFIAAAMVGAIALGAPWVAETWLNVKGYSNDEVTAAIRWMAISVAAQFATNFYTLALGGLQRQDLAVALQVLGNSLRYLGGVAVVAGTGGVVEFFVFQGFAAIAVAATARYALLSQTGPRVDPPAMSVKPRLRDFARFSGGMFLTAALAAIVANGDRLAVSKLMEAEMLGRYTIAATAIGLLQMFIFAVHRVYQPRFSQLHAAADVHGLRRAYYQACMVVGVTIVPLAIVFLAYTPVILELWLGWADRDTTLAARLLVLGFAMAGLMWLPASYQQAIGWARLNVWLMAVAILVGVPLLIMGIRVFGLAGAAALMLTHGLIQISVGLWAMNRICFPGESLLWYRRVVIRPMLICLPVVATLKWLMPAVPGFLGMAAWLLLNVAAVAALIYLDRDRILSVESRA